MSIFAKPVAPSPREITSLPWDTAYGVRSDAGEPVNGYTALKIPTVWRCITLVSDLLAALPVDVYRGSGADKTALTSQPAVVRAPSLRITRREWVGQYVAGMMLHGSVIGVVMSFTAAGLPETVEWVDRNCVTIECANGLSLPEYYIDGRHIPRDRIVHIRNFMLPGYVDGLSPIEYHAQTLGINLAARKYGAQWFGQGAHPSAILSTDMRIDQDQAQQMKQRFMASIRGKREPAVLGAGIKYTPVQATADASRFLETIGATDKDTALILGVPPEFVGAAQSGSSLDYANREQRWADFIATCLNHYAVRLEDAWGGMLPRPQSVKFNLDALLRGDTITRYQAHEIGIRAGFETVDEARELEDRPKLAAPAPTPEEDRPR